MAVPVIPLAHGLLAGLPYGSTLAYQTVIGAPGEWEALERLLRLARSQCRTVLGRKLLQRVRDRALSGALKDLIPQTQLTGEAMARSIIRQLADELAGAAQVLEQASAWLQEPQYIGGGLRAVRLTEAAGSLRATAEGYR